MVQRGAEMFDHSLTAIENSSHFTTGIYHRNHRAVEELLTTAS